ncbi:MAG: endopeptidase La [Victivallales bacterium]|nr:endopeptidase La [Victivallales bacterium]MCF7888967.1 endopeptidase La [Victivallales bacterium]
MNNDNNKKDNKNINYSFDHGDKAEQTDAEVLDAEEVKPQKKNLPILPLADIVIFPYTLSTLVIDREETIKFITKISEGERLIGLFPDLSASKLEKKENLETLSDQSLNTDLQFDTVKIRDKNISSIGVMGRIVKLLRFPDNTIRVLVRGLKRIKFVELIQETPNLIGTVEELAQVKDSSLETVAMARNAQNQFQEIINMTPNFPEEMKVAILNVDDYSRLVDLIVDSLNISFTEKLGILTAPTLNERLQLLTMLLNREVEVLHLGNEIQNQVSNALSQSQREFFLREQLKTIKQELGEEDANPDITTIRKRMEKKKLPEKVSEVIEKELERLQVMPQAASEYHVAYNYIDWLLAVPWKDFTKDRDNIKTAKKILDTDHYGLRDVKERILEFLAVLQMKDDRKSPILCFVGPPGVGKTSLGKSIARAMKRKFVRMSLGGVRDEAEIRGHRRTYVGALPGRIIQGLKKAQSANPVFMLDEVDKLGNDFRGDPASALLEVLDPQQNNSFNDHFLELDFDLSSVMFITTANIIDTIPPPLLDRMEVIRLPGYTPSEKRQIAKRYLVPRQLKDNGLTKRELSVPLKTLDELIDFYTVEAGVRNLERTIGSLCRKVAKKIMEGEISKEDKTTINPTDVSKFLGHRKFLMEEMTRKPEIGLAIGMAWTAVGGSVLPVESTMMPGKGEIQLTGSLGNIMKESAQAAFSYIKSRHKDLGIKYDVFKRNNFHIHVPDGATPKDGPSAGITIAVSMISLFTGKKVRVRTSMTGEINLRGKVTVIGGVREKVTAALRTGINTVVMPKQNEKDLEEVPDDVKSKLKFVFVENIQEALDFLLLKQ